MSKKSASYLVQKLAKENPRLNEAFRNLDDRIKLIEREIGLSGLFDRRLKVDSIKFSGDSNLFPLMSARTQRCKLGHSVAQIIATGVDTVLAWDSEQFDTDDLHDTVTDNSRITIRTEGAYLIGSNILWAANATGARRMQILQDGSTVQSTTTVSNAGAALQTGLNNVILLDLDKDDYLEIRVFQDSGGNLNVVQAGTRNPCFWAVMVGEKRGG